ncbi:MAG: hypothetical protein HRT34_08600 [Alcanivorax sp.]|nr:hypothetical protein [Alcanivorax sp.]
MLDAHEMVAVHGQQQHFVKRPPAGLIDQVAGAGGEAAFQVEQPLAGEAD